MIDIGHRACSICPVSRLIVAFDLADSAGFERGSLEPVQDLFGEERFDDGDDLFHGSSATFFIASPRTAWEKGKVPAGSRISC